LFIATLGHEIRNPLAALDGAVRLVEEGVVKVDDMFPKLVVYVRRLVSLIDDLLTISRIARGKVSLNKEVIDLVKVLRAAAQDNSVLIEEKNLELTMKLPEAQPVEGDAIRMEQVFANLISNAAKYTPEGGSIEVRVTQKGEKIIAEVEDNGSGIDASQFENIFEPFVQNLPDNDGLGLGLPLARGLVRLHGGTLGVASPGPGKGSVFTVKIPVGKLKEKKDDNDRESAENVRGLRVLFVDDLPDAADALGLLLRTEGAETKCAYTGKEAVEMAKKWKPDVAVIDLGLPDISGYDVARQVRAEHSDTLLLALTGFANDETAEKALLAGFAERLVKPVDYKRLRRVLSRHRASLHD
jgi:CheY-like chemotaxis protein